MISVQISGTEGVEKELGRVVFKSRQAVADFAQEIYDRAQAGADAHTKTGAMARSLQLRQYGTDGWEIYHDLAHARHALFVHWGTKAHVIKPKNKKVLRWVSGGVFRFARVVNHPGYQGDPYLTRAAQSAVRDFDAIVSRRLNA
jgi:hypothetical protein